MMKLVILLALPCLMVLRPENTDGYRILGAFPFHARSHFMMFEALMKGLARKGHQVDVISPFPQKRPYPNYTDIIHYEIGVPKLVNNMSYSNFNSMTQNLIEFISIELGNKVCDHFGNPDMMKLIRNPPKDPPYDLVITEVFSAHCFMALGHHFKVPTIAMSSTALYHWGNGMIGNPANLAFVSNTLVNFYAPMKFWERLYNFVDAIYSDIMFQYYTTPQDDVIRKALGEKAPGIREVEKSLALILTNSHPALNGPRPLTPALIEVGGLHVQDDGTELPRDLKEWMDNSKEGFIYFTFGSMVTIETFPKEILQIFYKSLEKIAPIKILLKIPDPKKLPPGLPKNIRTFQWAPQIKVLKHENIKAFITHGGLMGSQEAIHYAVPMIAMPLFGDQLKNVDLYVRQNIAIKLNHREITEEKMDTALNEVLYNPMWKKNAVEFSKKFLDRPMSSMETSIWWVEYIIRHGADALRSPAMDLTWWQIELLDVYAALLLITGLIISIVIILLRFGIKFVFIPKKPTIQISKKNK